MFNRDCKTKQNLLKEFKDGFKETFFSDNPLQSFKGQSTSRRFLILLEAIFPIIGWLRSYSFSKFRGHLLSGVIASMQVPQDIAYAKLANLAPQYGLYNSNMEDKFDFIACMGAFFGVIFRSVEIGLLIALCLSFRKIMFRATRSWTSVLGKLSGSSEYRNIQQYPEASMVPGVLIIKERIVKWLNATEDQKAGRSLPRYLILDLSSVSDIDTSGTHALEKLYMSLKKKNVQLVIGGPGELLVDKLHASGSINIRSI